MPDDSADALSSTGSGRRELLRDGAATMGVVMGLGALPAFARPARATEASAAGAHPNASLPADPASQNAASVRLYGDSVGGDVLWRTRGVVYAVQPTGITPLYAMLGSERSWWRRIDATTWVRYPSTLSFFRDLRTGEWLEEFPNPLNGRTVKLPASFIRHKEGEYYTPNGHYFGSMKRQFPEYYADEPVSLDWDLVEDVVRVHGTSKFPPILPQPSLESSTLFARASELFDPRVTRATAHSSGWNIFAWHPYLEMGDAPGHVIWHFDAVKVQSVTSLAAAYLERARAFTSRFDSSPETDEGPTFFERMLQRRRPQ